MVLVSSFTQCVGVDRPVRWVKEWGSGERKDGKDRKTRVVRQGSRAGRGRVKCRKRVRRQTRTL